MSSKVHLELIAATFGVLGTVLLALNGPRAGWGFVAYLVSNAGWIAFAWTHGHWGLLAQQVAFTVSSLLGVWVWLVKPGAAETPAQQQLPASNHSAATCRDAFEWLRHEATKDGATEHAKVAFDEWAALAGAQASSQQEQQA